jgi:hypothetical protein
MARQNEVYTFYVDGDLRTGECLGINSLDKFLIQDKVTKEVFILSESEITKESLYTIKVMFYEDINPKIPRDFLCQQGAVKAGDILVYHTGINDRHLCEVLAVDTQCTHAYTRFKGSRILKENIGL